MLPVPPRELADLGGQSDSQESRNPSSGRERDPSPKAQVGEKRGGSPTSDKSVPAPGRAKGKPRREAKRRLR